MQYFRDKYITALKDAQERVKVLDVGSSDFNGSYRNLFSHNKYEYKGLDAEPGPNVDLVPQHLYRWDEIRSDEFDVVISGQAFEHIEFFWETLHEMIRILRKDGMLCIIAPSKQKEHRYPVDCYRFFNDGMIALAKYFSLELLESHCDAVPIGILKDFSQYQSWISVAGDSMLICRKPYPGNPRRVDLREYRCEPSTDSCQKAGFIQCNDALKALNLKPKRQD